MHIAVLADNIADRKQTERLLDRANSALASEIGTLYVDSFGDESSFLPVCMKYDLFLLDIDHDMAHCMEIVARLQELSAPGMIVVCKDAAEPYRRENAIQHLYTLDKPILTAPLHKLLRDIQQEIKSQKQNLTMIEIRDIEHTHFVSKDDIIYARCFEKEHRVHYVFDHHDAIDIIGNMDDTESDLARTLLGTAWSIRSICYYNLMQRYCEPYQPETAKETLGLPLVDDFDMEAKPARANLKETAEFIEEGFRKALSYNVSNEDFIFTSSVTKAYFARFFFWTQNWSNAITYAKEVLEKYPMLEADEYVEAINQKQAKAHNVIIRSFTMDDDIGTMSYATAQADIKSRPVDRNLVDLFAATDNDVRRRCNYDSKRIVNKIITTKFRSEELCLIIAEAHAHLNQETDALGYLNQLRSKRITQNYIAYTIN